MGKPNEQDLFFCNVEKTPQNEQMLSMIEEYSKTHREQVYIISKILGSEKDYVYALKDIAIILSVKHEIAIVHYGDPNPDALENLKEDLKEDLAHLADKFGYTQALGGRMRNWPDVFHTYHINHFNVNEYISSHVNPSYYKKIELLISLFTGSINDIERVGTEDPGTLLEKIKKNVILFDGKQTKFIYGTDANQQVITIQGLAGTGKTELFLNKLVNLYTKEKNSVIAFTCHNIVLAQKMKNRVKEFFDFKKVSEQIKEERLHIFHGWGSLRDKTKIGMYSYICQQYSLHFSSFDPKKQTSLEELAETALKELDALPQVTPCFDYIFIDESQDFGPHFVALCAKVCRKQVYVAGDIFQNIFDSMESFKKTQIDFSFNNCYRTDPRTLLFAHAVGMGLCEPQKLNWLKDDDWENSGYHLERIENNKVRLSRNKLRRFDDLNLSDTIRMLPANTNELSQRTIDTIGSIIQENPDVIPSDIAVIILDQDYNAMNRLALLISDEIKNQFHWNSVLGYRIKNTQTNAVFISNLNNAKGLEFPFLICIIPGLISNSLRERNGIYTCLTRSFLTSYFIINNCNAEFIKLYANALQQINQNGYLEVTEPTAEEKTAITTQIKNAIKQPLPPKEFIRIMKSDGIQLSAADQKYVFEKITEMREENNLSDDEILESLRKRFDI